MMVSSVFLGIGSVRDFFGRLGLGTRDQKESKRWASEVKYRWQSAPQYRAVDDLRLKPAWKDNRDLSELKGKAVLM